MNEKDEVDLVLDYVDNAYHNKKLQKRIGLFTLFISAFLLLSPTVYPLTNPFVNPNFPFESLPIEYQNAYAEIMTPQFDKTIRTATESIDVYTLHDQPYKYVHTFGVPPYVLDISDNTYKDSYITENSTHIEIVNEENPIVFKKSDCTFIKYTDSSFSTKFVDYYTTMATKTGTNSWSVYNALQLDCSYSRLNNATHNGLVVTRVHPKGTFEATYAKLVDGNFKSYMKFTNNLQNVTHPQFSGLQNTKVSFVEVLGNITASSFNIDNTNKWNSIEVSQQKVWTQSNMTSKLFSIGNQAKLFSIDLGSDYTNLLALRATKTTTTTFDLEIAFGATAQTLVYGQVVITDPTYSSNNPTVDGNIEDTNNDDICNGTTVTKVTDGTSVEIGRDASTGSIDCDRAFFEYSISTIPKTAGISNSVFKFEADTPTGTPDNCIFVGMTQQPSVASDANIWSGISSGTSLVTDSACTTVGQNKSVDLGSAGDTYVTDQLTSGWVALGVKSSVESPLDTNNYLAKIIAEDGIGTPAPTLEITYYIKIKPNAPQSALTATAQEGSIRLVGTESSSGFDNATQPAETNMNLYRCVVEDCTSYLGHELDDGGSNSEGNEGNAKMGTLGNTLLLHFNRTGTANGKTSFFDTHESGGGRTNGTVTGLTLTANYNDTFGGSDTWDDNSASMGVDTTLDIFTGSLVADNTNDASAKDLTSTSDTIWIARFFLKFTESVAGDGRTVWIGISDLSQASGTDVNQDFIGLKWEDDLRCIDADGGSITGGGTAMGYGAWAVATDYFIQVQRSSTSYTVGLYPDVTYTTPTDTCSEAVASSTQTLRYLKVLNYKGTALGSGTVIVDNAQFFNSATSTTGSASLIKGQFPRESRNNAVNLNSANINITSSDITFEGTEAWSLAVLLNMSNSNPFTLFSADMGSSRSTNINVNDNSITLHNTGTSVFNYSLTSMGTNKVNFIGVTRSSSGNFCVYQNLTQVSCATTNATTLGSSNTFFINSMPNLSNFGTINLDDFALFNTTLTQAQMLDIATRGSLFNFTRVYMNSTIATNSSTVTDNAPAGNETWCYDYSYSNSMGQGSLFNTLSCATALPEAVLIRLLEGDKATAVASATITQANSTGTCQRTTNSTGWIPTPCSGITTNSNFTSKDSDNYVTNKTYNFIPQANFQINSLVFRVSCPENGSGNDVLIKLNTTNYHLKSSTTPTCSAGNFNVTWTGTFTADGNAPNHSNLTSIGLFEVLNITAFGKQPIRFRENGTAISTTYSSPDITSSSFDIGSGYQTRVISFNLALDPKPVQTGLSVSCTSNTACVLTITHGSAGVAGISGTFIEKSTDSGSTWSTLVANTGSATTSYTDSGLTTGTRYDYRVSSINQYGTGQASASAWGITGSGDSGGGSTPASGGSTPSVTPASILPTIQGLQFKTQEHNVMPNSISYGKITIIWDGGKPITIKSIDVGQYSGWMTFDPMPPYDLSPEQLSTALIQPAYALESSSGISYQLHTPQNFCDVNLGVTQNCVEKRLYKIPVNMVLTFDGIDHKHVTEILVDFAGEALEVADIQNMIVGTVLITMAFGGYGFVRVLQSRKKRGLLIRKVHPSSKRKR